MDQVAAATVLALCQKYGSQLLAPAGLDGAKVMAAIASNESSLGANCKPRYEESYDRDGVNFRNAQVALVEKYGRDAACRYGPWQILPCNALEYSPALLRADPELCAKAFVKFFNNYIIRLRGARTLEQIAQVYNSGSVHTNPPAGVLRYMDDARSAYTRLVIPAQEVSDVVAKAL